MQAGDIVIGSWDNGDGTSKRRPLLVLEVTQLGLLRVAYGTSQRCNQAAAVHGELVVTPQECPELKMATRFCLKFRELTLPDQVQKIASIVGNRSVLLKLVKVAREANLA